MYKNIIKPLLDFIFSFISIIILSPLFLLIIISIRLDSNGSAFYSQTRVGKNGKVFKLYKFRSMLSYEESILADGSEMNNYDRVTKIGHVLRKTSLDELPQLLNILLGDMSLIGPRPTLEYQVERYNEYQMQRLEVKPGLTGLAQVNGRNSLTWKEKINYDITYVKNLSLALDIKIFFKTFSVLLKHDDNKFEKHDSLSKHDGSTLDDVNK